MKTFGRVVALVAIAGFVASVAGCGNGSNDSTTADAFDPFERPTDAPPDNLSVPPTPPPLDAPPGGPPVSFLDSLDNSGDAGAAGTRYWACTSLDGTVAGYYFRLDVEDLERALGGYRFAQIDSVNGVYGTGESFELLGFEAAVLNLSYEADGTQERLDIVVADDQLHWSGTSSTLGALECTLSDFVGDVPAELDASGP